MVSMPEMVVDGVELGMVKLKGAKSRGWVGGGLFRSQWRVSHK